MYAPRALARFNRVVTNPIQRRWAGRLPLHGIVTHVGRKSGRVYRTPLLCFRRGDRVAFIVGYGLQSDWARNLIASGGGELQHRGRSYVLSDVALLPPEAGRPLLPWFFRKVTGVIGIGSVVSGTITPR
ncbi:nitroreductase family deazaflavin-dependent oxidoreductase [Nocardioides montaniterrae]